MGFMRHHVGRKRYQVIGSDRAYGADGGLPTVRGAGTALFSETFADANFASRGWYSIVSADRVATPAPVGSPGSLRCTWTAGQTVPSSGGMRHLFTPTDRIYIKYQTSFSANWVGSGQAFQPHIIYLLSDLDNAFAGPSDSFLNIAIDLIYAGGNRPRVYFQDNQYVDAANIGLNVSEARATCGGNGQQGYADSWDFFADASFSHGYYQTRNLDGPVVMAAGNTAWHTVEVEVILNTIVGGIGQTNGICRYWFDGVQIWERTNLIMRTGTRPNLMINQFGIAPYMGTGSPVTQTMYIADIDVRISRSVTVPGLVQVSAFDGGRIADVSTVAASGIPDWYYDAAPRHLVFNSLEPGAGPVGTNPNYLCSDDFSRGAWYEVDADHSGTPMGTLTCGWMGNIYENPITPPNAVVGGGEGLHGRQFAASSGFMDGSPGGRNMANREFGGVNVTEVYWRIYFKTLPGYVGGHEKQFDFVRGRGHGGLVCLSYIRGNHVDYISYLHQDDDLPGGVDSWLTANMAPAVQLVNGHWNCIEMHVRLNTPGVYDGVYEMWMDDCGTDGRSQPTSLTLRARYTNVLWRSAAESDVDIGGIWIENWANPGSTGTEYYANLIVSRAPIGPAPMPELIAASPNWLANRPANYTNVWTDYPFNDPIPVGGDTLVVPGGFWHQVFNAGYLSRVADATGPVSPGYVLQNHNYPGMPSGGGSGGLYGYIANGTTEVYVSLMSKWDSNYEWNAISNKFFIFEPDHIIIESNHNTGQWWTVEWSNPNTFLTSNIVSTPITLNVWHNVEILLRRGPSGRIRIWVDGVLHMDHSVAIPLTVEPYQQTMNLANTWGGATGPTTRDSYRWTDHVFIATP